MEENNMTYKNGEFQAAGWCKVLRRWTKADHDRIYINNANGTSCGYIDLQDGTAHANGTYENMAGWNEYCEAILALEI